jgi:hypothetical protein
VTRLNTLARAAVGTSCEYVFHEGRAATFAVEVIAERDGFCFKWPRMMGSVPWDTALLEVDVATESQPDVFAEIVCREIQERQYFPPRANGRAWLNLSSLQPLIRPGGVVRMFSVGVNIVAQCGTLRLFAARPDRNSQLLIVAPHPDDAEIASFGLYADRSASILTITSGNDGVPSYEGLFDGPADMYSFKGRLRVIDSVTVPWHGGIPPDRCVNLGYFDSRLADMVQAPDRAIPERHSRNTDVSVYRAHNLSNLLPRGARQSTWTNLVEDIETVLRAVAPSIIVAPHPQLDAHVDHQFTTVALAQALRR